MHDSILIDISTLAGRYAYDQGNCNFSEKNRVFSGQQKKSFGPEKTGKIIVRFPPDFFPAKDHRRKIVCKFQKQGILSPT